MVRFKYNKAFAIDMKKLTAIIQKDENMYVARCAEIGTVSQGRTAKQALKNLKEATELYLEEKPIKGISKPIFATFEVAESVRT